MTPAPLTEPGADLLDIPTSDPVIGRSCSTDQSESCSLTLAEHDGMISCYEGTRSCQGGVLGPCENGYTFTLERGDVGAASRDAAGQRSASLRPLSFSEPTECLNNPCNRYCREFIEAPMGGLTAAEDPSAPPLSIWPAGSLSDYPPEWVAMGVQEPCQVAGDCQFNTSCVDPALGSCEHSVCSKGEPLITGCNRCAEAVCAIDADCCGSQPACVHDPCDTGFGAPLERNCDPCVDAVCRAHPECCDTTWNDLCVGYVATECAPLGQSCGCPDGSVQANGNCYHSGDRRLDFGQAVDACTLFGTQWNLVQVDDAAENDAARSLVNDAAVTGAWLGGLATNFDEWTWRASGQLFFVNDATGGSLQSPFTYENWEEGQPTLGVAGDGMVMNASGEWHHEAQGNQLDYICEGPPSTLNPRLPSFSWNAACVDLAERTCGVQCPSNVPLGLGGCVSRLPTELDANCTSFDLALGASCEDAGRPQIPVCNHGQTAAPVGLRLSYVKVSEFGKATPDLTTGADCVLSEPIPPGRCIVVSDCPGLDKDAALVVNPGDVVTQNTAECRVDDNWSVYQPISCGAPVCEAGTHSMAQVASNDCSLPVQNPLGLDLKRADVQLRPEIPEPHCGPKEEMWGASCYFFSDTVEYWDRAEGECVRRGGHLVALNSPAENTWVRSSTSPLRDIQIGLNDKDIEGDHVWSNGTCRRWDNWDTLTMQPNDSPPGGEQCARMTPGSADRWEDTACNDDQHLYVCEMPIQDAQGACATGERMGPDGNCYFFDSKEVSAAEASDTCRNHGLGWSLVLIDSIKINDFITGGLDCTPAWIGGVNPSLTGFSVMIGDPYIDELGLWQGAVDGLGRATLCQGPALPAPPRQLTEVGDFSLCSGGDEFYFDGGSAAPESLTLCPATCLAGSALPGSRLDVEIPCDDPGAPVQETSLEDLYYEADCDGGSAIWDFFYYDAVTPADSRIEFEVRTAPTKEELEAGTVPFTAVAQAHAIPTDTQRCEVSPPNCPIDIFSKLGNPSQQYRWLQLKVKLVPGTSGEGPLLRDWRVRYSCPPSQ